jgi:alpha-N-arabinofuranosidase
VRGLYQCEINPLTGAQLTQTRFLWPGTGGAYPEGPHLFRRGLFYYLLAAEGGTAEGHMVTVARSRDPYGPFESCPRNPVLSHRSLMGEVHATGHADFFEDHEGNSWVVFLGFRYGEHGWHHLGRETFLAPVEWDADGWPVVNGGRPVTLEMETGRMLEPHPWPAEPVRDDFDAPALSPAWVHLRNPRPDGFSLSARPGFLRLNGSPISLDETANPSCILRRMQHMEFTARAALETGSDGPDEAGLTVLIDHRHRADLIVRRRNGRREAVLRRRIGPAASEGGGVGVPDGPVVLEVAVSPRLCRFAVVAGGDRTDVGEHETRYLSTEVAGGYTGAMIGPFAFSADGGGHADFDWFEYLPGPA